MESKDLQPIATIIAAIIGGAVTAVVTLKLQDKKRNDDLVLKAFDHSLTKRLKEFEQKLIGDNSYLAEKGKNEAIKEDLDEINQKLESIKTDFSKRGTLFRLQAEKEFDVYSKIWERVIELKFAVEELRPVLDFVDPNEPASERWSRRYANAVKNGRNLRIEVENLRPFYPHALFLQFQNILQKTQEEIVDFEFSLDQQKEKMSLEGYKKGRENLGEILDNLNQVCDLIRKRISESE